MTETTIPIGGAKVRRQGLAFGFLATVIWGGFLVASRYGLGAGLRVTDLAFLRYLTAGLILPMLPGCGPAAYQVIHTEVHDALIEIAVRPPPLFRRDGDNIHVELPIPLRDAVLGGKVAVPTPTGTVTMTVPKWSNSGTVLRLKGRGVPRPNGAAGDEYVTLKIMLPEKRDPALEKLISQWASANAGDQRQAMGA